MADKTIAGAVKKFVGAGEKKAPIKSVKLKVKFQKVKNDKKKRSAKSINASDKYVALSNRQARKKRPSPAKAKMMLKDNSAGGRPLTQRQKGFFGAIAGGNSNQAFKRLQSTGSRAKVGMANATAKLGRAMRGAKR